MRRHVPLMKCHGFNVVVFFFVLFLFPFHNLPPFPAYSSCYSPHPPLPLYSFLNFNSVLSLFFSYFFLYNIFFLFFYYFTCSSLLFFLILFINPYFFFLVFNFILILSPFLYSLRSPFFFYILLLPLHNLPFNLSFSFLFCSFSS